MATTDLTVSVLLYESPGVAAPETTDSQTFNMSYNSKRFTIHYRRGFWAQVKFSTPGGSPATEGVFVLDGYDWLVIPGGRRGLNE